MIAPEATGAPLAGSAVSGAREKLPRRDAVASLCRSMANSMMARRGYCPAERFTRGT